MNTVDGDIVIYNGIECKLLEPVGTYVVFTDGIRVLSILAEDFFVEDVPVSPAEKESWNDKSEIELGESSKDAYSGDKGKIAYDHSQALHAPSNAQKNSDISKAEIEAKLTGIISSHTHLSVGGETYETVSKNLKSYPYVITYSGDNIDYITYDLSGGQSIVKTFNYTGDNLTSIVLSGDTPSGIDLTKTLTYTSDELTDIIYS